MLQAARLQEIAEVPEGSPAPVAASAPWAFAEAWLPQGSATSGWVLGIRGTRYSAPTPSQSAKKAILGRSTSLYPA